MLIVRAGLSSVGKLSSFIGGAKASMGAMLLDVGDLNPTYSRHFLDCVSAT